MAEAGHRRQADAGRRERVQSAGEHTGLVQSGAIHERSEAGKEILLEVNSGSSIYTE